MAMQQTISNAVSASGYGTRNLCWMTNRWIEDRIDVLAGFGKTKKGLADRLGLPQPRVTEIINGDRQVKLTEVQALSEYLDMPISAVMNKLGAADNNARFLDVEEFVQVEVLGYVQAGIWRDTLEVPEAERGTVMIPKIAGNPTLFGLEVRGDSMNEVFKPGSVVVCQHFLHFQGPITDGMFVIVERRDGAQFEATVKQLQIRDGHYYLAPRSTNPTFSAFEVPSPADWNGVDDTEIRIVAVVVKSIQNHLPGL